jgi:alkylhydroperoxidase family enzyme
VVENPWDVGADPASRVIAGLARLVTEAPWTLERGDLARARAAGLSDDLVLTVIALSTVFNYLNRMADSVGIELDYDVLIRPPAAVPETPAMARAELSAWPDPDAPQPLELSRKPALAAALADCRTYVMERDAPLSIPQRQVIARAVAERLGDAATVRRLIHVEPRTEVDRALERFADVATLAPWRLGAETFELLRAALGAELAAFDAISVTAFANLASRLDVALAALGR